jgi:hypothetical protein
MEIAAGKRDPDPVRTTRTRPSGIHRLAAGVPDVVPVSLGRPVDNSALPTDRVKQAPEPPATAAQATDPMRAIGLASGRNRMKWLTSQRTRRRAGRGMFRAFCVRPRNRAATIADSDGHCLLQWLSSGPSGVFQHPGRSASPLGKATQPLNRFDGQVNIQCWKKSRQRTTAPACDADHTPSIAPPHKGDRWVAQRPARSTDTD